MVESAKHWLSFDMPAARNGPSVGRILPQRKVRALQRQLDGIYNRDRWRSHRFSASSRLRDLNRLAIRTAVACRTANIERQDATILPWHANPAPDGIFGKDTDAIRQIGVSEVTFYRWRQEYGGLKSDQVKRLKELELEPGNTSTVTDTTLPDDAGSALTTFHPGRWQYGAYRDHR
jgi:hypothetical protein